METVYLRENLKAIVLPLITKILVQSKLLLYTYKFSSIKYHEKKIFAV